MAERRRFSGESGVSETIGFIIIFGIVMTGIGIVTLYGYPALMQEQDNANIRNMEKNMLVLQSDLKSLTYKNVPYQETSMQVSGGTLSVRAEPESAPYFTISVSGAPIVVHKPGEIKYLASNLEANIALENGAVHIRYWDNPTGSAMLAPPSWFYDSVRKTYVIQLIQLNASSDLGRSGIATVKMQMLDPPVQDGPINITGEKVTVSYRANPEEDYMIAWRNYFESPDLNMRVNTTTPGVREVSYDLDPSADWLIVKRYNITVLSL